MASTKDSSATKKRTAWTLEMNSKLFMAIIATLPSNAFDHAAIAERVGEGHTARTIYKRIYDLKNKPSADFAMAAAPPTTGPGQRTKKRKHEDDDVPSGAAVAKEYE